MKVKYNFIRNLAIYVLDMLGVDHINEDKIYLVQDILGSTALFKVVKTQNYLTVREKSYLLLLAHGRSKEEISDLLNVKERTLSHYQRKIAKKLGYKDAISAVLSKEFIQSELLERYLEV